MNGMYSWTEAQTWQPAVPGSARLRNAEHLSKVGIKPGADCVGNADSIALWHRHKWTLPLTAGTAAVVGDLFYPNALS